MKALVGAFNQEKALVGAFSVLRDCEIFRNIRITFVSSTILDALLRLPVVVVVKPLPDRAQVHRLLDDLEVVGEAELDRVHREVEGPGVVMLPHGLHDAAPEDGELVGVAAAAPGWRLERRLEHSIDRSNLHLRPDRGLAGVPAPSIQLVNNLKSLH